MIIHSSMEYGMLRVEFVGDGVPCIIQQEVGLVVLLLVVMCKHQLRVCDDSQDSCEVQALHVFGWT
jgi:hypothetical protein